MRPITSLVLLMGLLPAAAAQTPITPTVLVKSLDNFTGSANRIMAPTGLAAGTDGGYAATFRMQNLSSSLNFGTIWGDLVDDGTTSPTLLRTAQVIGSRSQTLFGQLAISGGTIAYASYLTNPAGGFDLYSFWIDDVFQFAEGDPAPLAGHEMLAADKIQMTAPGQATVQVRMLDSVGGGVPKVALIDYPGGIIRVGPGSPVIGTSLTMANLISGSVSPDGLHYVCISTLSDGRRAVIHDGQIYQIDGVDIALGGIIPARAGGDGVLRWLGLSNVNVDDRNRVTFVGQFATGSFLQEPSMVVRDGNRLVGSPDVLMGSELRAPRTALAVSASGRVAAAWRGSQVGFSGVEFVLDNVWLTRSGTVGVDVSGNGIGQPEWRLTPTATGLVFVSMAVTARGDVLLTHSIERGTDVRQALMRLRPMPGVTSCDAQPNSTGFPSQLIALGQDIVLLNELTLRAVDLPPNSLGYFLSSRTSGFSGFAGGSSGDLCLGGAIGRYAGNVLSSGPQGVISMALDLWNIPQPTGTVAAFAGETWYFQLWHRDSVGGAATSNFSPAREVTFR